MTIPIRPANNDAPPDRYEAHADDAGWTVFDTWTGEPARIEGVLQVGLYIERSDGLVNHLNALERKIAEGTPR